MKSTSRYSLRITISALLVALLFLAVGGAVAITLLVRKHSLRATVRTLGREASRSVSQRIRSRVEPAEGILKETLRSAEQGRLPTEDGVAVALQLAERIRFDKRYEWLAYLGADGSAGGAAHGPDGSLRLLYATAGRPEETEFVVEVLEDDGSRTEIERRPGGLLAFRNMPWYEAGAAAEGPIWSKRYIREYDGTPGRACAVAFRKDGELQGVFGIGYGMAFLAEYIRGIEVGEEGRLFGVNLESGQISLSPTEEDLARLGPVVLEAVSLVPGGLDALEDDDPFHASIRRDGTKYAVVLDKEEVDGTLRWVSALVVPEKELVGFLDRYATVALLGIAALLLGAIALAQVLARRVSRPLRVIAEDLRKVAEFELTESRAPATRIQEVAVVGDSVDRMKAGLRSFSKYVPTDLVRDLVRAGQDARLDGSMRPLTLFFSDVKGFTSVSEGMDPQVLVDALGEYLDVVVKAISAEQGTIDKFMGDGVLAFFNAPRADADHAAHGCRAALRVQKALSDARIRWLETGRPSFETRIGLHTDDVIVGNIGTPDRFSYTVLGDGVNLAARLESVNKAYGTWILASEATKTQAGDGFVWRRVDRTAVAGRAEGVDIFELLGYEGDVDAATLEARDRYEQAFSLYLDRRFTDAAEVLEELARRQPSDPATRVLADRAQAYAETPPPSDWVGVYVQTKK